MPTIRRLRGCVICRRLHWHPQKLRNSNCRKMRLVYAACLTAGGVNPRQAARTKQETSTLAGIEVSTTPYQDALNGRAASAQSDTLH